MAKQITDARQPPFVWFDTKLDDAGLSPYAFRLYCRIARRTGGGKHQFFEALTNAAAACKMSERQARYAIKDLLKYRMVKCLQKMPGYPTIYALTDKSEWIFPAPAPDAPLHQMQETPALNAGAPLHQMQEAPAPDAGVPLHHVPTKKNHVRKGKKKTATTEAAAASAFAHAGLRAKPAAAALSIYSRRNIEIYVTETKPHSTNPGGLARRLHESGEEDEQIAAWIRAQAEQDKAALRQQQPISPAALDALRSEANALGLHIPGLN